jgi:hypothetical protein
MYKVIKYFVDLKDNNREYNAGDAYPREGYTPTAERIAELSGSENLQKQPLIEKVAAAEKPAPKKKPAAKK